MDDDTTSNGTEHAPVKHEGEEVRPVVWTPEDASRFLSTAIHEAQKPLADALKQRPATTPVLALIVAILVIASVAIGWILANQLAKSESAAETARTSRDSAVARQYELKTKADTLEASLAAARDEQERLSGQVEGKRDSEEELRKVQSEVARFRRQNDLLKNQIAGLELEKQALSRQLEAVKAMAIDEEFDDYVTIDEPPVPGPATPAPEASPLTEPEAPPAEGQETTTSKAEPPSEEALNIGAGKAEPAPAPVQPAESQSAPETPAAKLVSISGNETSPATAGTVSVEQIAEKGSEAGTLTMGVNGQNPPTLYESTRMMENAPIDAADAAPVQITSAAPIPASPAIPSEPEAAVAAEEPVKEEQKEEQKEEVAPEAEAPPSEPVEDAATEIEQPQAESGEQEKIAAEEPVSEEPRKAEEEVAEAPEPEESAAEEPAASPEPESRVEDEAEPAQSLSE